MSTPTSQPISAPVAASSSPRSSTSSDSFSSARRSPTIHANDSSAALIIVPEHGDHDDDDLDVEDPASFEFLSSSDDDSQDGESSAHYLESQPGGPYSSAPPLSSLAVFLYLLSPFLKLGALLSSSVGVDDLPLRISLPALFLFASLCALTRQIWYMLARYVRKADMEEIVLQTFARGAGRGREGERKRRLIRIMVRLSTGLVRVLLVAVYLRVSVDAVLPLLPHSILQIIPSRVAVTLLFALGVSPFCLSPSSSLSATTVLCATWLSVVTYTAWIASMAYGHAKGLSIPTQIDVDAEGSLGALWQGLSIIAFTFSTSSTLPLYASLRSNGSSQNRSSTSKPRRTRSFILSVGSIVLAALLVLPPTLSRVSEAHTFHSSSAQGEPPSASAPFAFRCLTAFLSATTLALGIPSVIVTAPTLPVPYSIRRRINHTLASRTLLYILSLATALMPSVIARLASDLLIVLVFLGTFTIPAFMHIVIHNFRRPLSIVMPPNTPSLQRSDSHDDELLQRKERTLQRRRFTQRLLWDIGVWVLLLPVGGGGAVWALGTVIGWW